MPLSKEFYLDEIKSKYPNSYNESLKDLPIKDLEDMLDFLEGALSKADGGSIGIEVLFKPKVPAAPSQLVEESEIVLGYRGDDAARGDMASGRSGGRADPSGGVDRSAVGEGSQYAKNVAAQNNKPSFKKKVKDFVTNPAVQTLGGAILTGGINTAFSGVLNKINKARMISNAIKYGKDIAIEDELDNITGISPYADGGRVGLFMGGPPLEGQALSIYNSMNAYGFSDQEIANALEGQGLYTPGGTTPDAPTTIQPIGYQGRGDDNPYPGQVVDQTDYSFNKKNYGPGEKLEINPAAVGMSFYDSTTGTSTPNKTVKEDKGIIGRTIDSFMGAAVPGKQLSQFTSPTTGGTLTGPAELGFMTKNIEGIPGNLTRDDLRSMYDNYNKFLGRPSNFANARVKGPAGELINLIPVVGSAARMFGSGGDKSLQSKYTVDNAGFGNTGMRDEFGLFTGQKRDGFLGIFGDPTGPDYLDRMSERLGELNDFFGSRIEGFDINNLDPATLSKMKGINSFYTKQIQAYQQRLATEKLNRQEKEKEKADALQARIDAERAAGRIANQQMQRQKGGGGGGNLTRSRAQGGLGLSAAQAQAISDANEKAGMGGFGLKDGGLATMFKRKR